MSDLENLYIKRNEAYKVNDIETVNNITEELDKLYPVKPKSVLCIDGKPAQFEIVDAREVALNDKQRNKSTYLIKDADGAINGKPTYARICIRKKLSSAN